MAEQSPSTTNGAARPGRDAVLADLLRMGDDVKLPSLNAGPEADPDVAAGRKVDEHGRVVGSERETERDDDEDDDLDEDTEADDDADEVSDEDDDDEEADEDTDEDEDEDEESAKPARRDEDDDEEEADEDEKPVEKKDERAKEDPDLERRRRSLQQQERRHRETVQRDRAALEREAADARRRIETEWAPRVAKAEKFEKLAERVRFDAPSVLIELGLKEDDFEDTARMLYAMSPAGSAKPENREAAARLARSREQSAETSAIKAEMEALKKKLAERDEQDSRTRVLEEWRGELADTAKAANAPLVRRVLAKNAAKAHADMEAIAYRLLQKNGRPPSAKKVVLVYEKQRRADLEDAGANPDELLKSEAKAAPTAVKKPDEKKPDEKREAKPAKKARPKTREEIRDELELELQEQDRRERMGAQRH